MPPVRFEPTIPVLERTNIVHALERAVTVTGLCSSEDGNRTNFRNVVI
jgi:hypothetical protein